MLSQPWSEWPLADERRGVILAWVSALDIAVLIFIDWDSGYRKGG